VFIIAKYSINNSRRRRGRSSNNNIENAINFNKFGKPDAMPGSVKETLMRTDNWGKFSIMKRGQKSSKILKNLDKCFKQIYTLS
jgi:hypothetical protein